ncbi:succinate dehydrogenase, hydrophobic membrane anchor protein [Hyphococcus sp.]|uniref:succinate dehydrogenase, hydrophobic membrane anchor protein n=1 Tax=Hyphococcus sp. TaxID=2038636 RepID=UPI00207D9946|nr:MAG: succinate dehydrogenase membrane anchor subunit [Marinicaulis sp.]
MAHKGTSTFIIQRASAALLIPLAIWFLIGVVSHLGADYAGARAWLASSPLNAIALALFITIGAWHMRIGMKEIIADYIHGGWRGVLSILNWLAALSLIAGALWSIYNISFVG